MSVPVKGSHSVWMWSWASWPRATTGSTIAAIHRWAPDFDVVVLDDGSTDATAEAAREAGVVVLPMPYNLGIGGVEQLEQLDQACAHQRAIVPGCAAHQGNQTIEGGCDILIENLHVGGR